MTPGCAIVDLDDLGLDEGATLLLRHRIASLEEGSVLAVHGTARELAIHLRAFARAEGHGFETAGADDQAASPNVPPASPLVPPASPLVPPASPLVPPASPNVPPASPLVPPASPNVPPASPLVPPASPLVPPASPLVARLTRGAASSARWAGAERAGGGTEGVVTHPPPAWGLAARGAVVEAGGPAFAFALDDRDEVWTDDAGAMYRAAAAAQWDPETAIPWDAARTHPEIVEDALVQVLTYLVENETAALVVPARFCAQVHPHFREVMQVLAIQAADEARHIEVFTRRALLARSELGLSTVGGQASLKTLVDESDFALASFLLSVLGEGSFVHLLGFLHNHAPDACTREIMRLTAQDEARHVAFGMAHLRRHADLDPTLRARMQHAIERRHDALRHTAGLNAEVFDALVLLAAGGLEPARIRRGHGAVAELVAQMDAGRRVRLRRLGFDEAQATALSALHTRNFM